MLWEIKDTPHRLLGSFHAIPKNTAFPEWVETAKVGMKRIVLEADNPVGQDMLRIGLDRSLAHKKLPGAIAAYKRANALMSSIGLSFQLDLFSPWRAAQFLSGAFLPHYGFLHEHGVDTQLRQAAERQHYNLQFLSSPLRSSELLKIACEKSDLGMRFFEQAISDIESGEGLKELNRLYRAWSQSDLKDLGAYLDENVANFPHIYEASTFQRNREWIPVSSRLMADETPTLFVVGSMHTVGDESFNKLLTEAGFHLNFIS